MPWTPEGHGPGSGAPHKAGSPLPAPSEFGQNFVVGFGKRRVFTVIRESP
jgi:hypothetical protein